MATTMFFEGTLNDKGGSGPKIDLEFGRSSYYDGVSEMYFTIDGRTVIIDRATAKRISVGMSDLAAYLSHDKD